MCAQQRPAKIGESSLGRRELEPLGSKATEGRLYTTDPLVSQDADKMGVNPLKFLVGPSGRF
jgi:hypothetical protein